MDLFVIFRRMCHNISMNANAKIEQLTPPQREIIDCGLLTSGFNCILQMPTGSGKTWLAEQAIADTLSKGKRAIYLTPLRALATELVERWQQQFTGIPIGIFTGDYGVPGKPYPVPFQKAQLLIMTPERLDACTRAWRAHWKWFPEVDLLVVDEIHLLGDQFRGARLEGALLRARRLNPFLRILGLSATLGNRAELADWLDGVEYVSDWRPIPIAWQIRRYRKATEKPELLLQAIQENIAAQGRSLVFVQSRRRAEELSRWLQNAGLRTHHHHAGLKQTDRRRVEEEFRKGNTQAIISTGTLEMGLNLPVRQVILYDLQTFDGTDYRPLDVNTVWQRVGRAGRPGQDVTGEAVLIAPVWDGNVERYARGAFEPIRSALFSERTLSEQIVAEVASSLSRSFAQLNATFQQSLAAHQGCLPQVQTVLNKMCDSDMIVECPDESNGKRERRFAATRLGRVAVRHMLAPTTLLLFRAVTERISDLTFFDLLLLASCSDDCEPLLSVDFEELDMLAAELTQEPTRLLHNSMVEINDLLEVRGKRFLAAIKMALVARAWTRRGSADEVAERFDCYPFEVVRLCESLDRLLIALCAMQETVVGTLSEFALDIVPFSEQVSALCQMVRVGMDSEAVTLTRVFGIGAGWAKKLSSAGITDIEALALSEVEEITTLSKISKKRATQWIASATESLKSGSAYRYRESASTISSPVPDWPSDIDPYRLRRAVDLQVIGADGGRFYVSGGLEPHIVLFREEGYQCDCLDAAKGNLCKHTLAVRLQRGDKQLQNLIHQLCAVEAKEGIDLYTLWMSSDSALRRKRR